MTKKELMVMLENFEDDTVVVIAKPFFDPWSGHRDGDCTYAITEVVKDKEEVKIYF
jgi:hypothetical protein